jgi:hypothetical protein
LLGLRGGALSLERGPELGREHLAADPPAGDIGEDDDGLRIGGQVTADGLVLVVLEEAGADVDGGAVGRPDLRV